MTVELDELHCLKQSLPVGEQQRPLAELDVRDHIHGRLVLRPDGRNAIHNFGYWNPADACIGDWLTVLARVNERVAEGGEFTFEYPYPDQGDPRVEFDFAVDTVTIRTTYYADDSWTEVEDVAEQPVDRASFERCIDEALTAIHDAVLSANPTVGAEWLKWRQGRDA